MRVDGLGLVLGLGFQVTGIDFQFSGLGSRVSSIGFRVDCLVFGIQHKLDPDRFGNSGSGPQEVKRELFAR